MTVNTATINRNRGALAYQRGLLYVDNPFLATNLPRHVDWTLFSDERSAWDAGYLAAQRRSAQGSGVVRRPPTSPTS